MIHVILHGINTIKFHYMAFEFKFKFKFTRFFT